MKNSFLLIIAVIFFWGIWGFLVKLAVQRIGYQGGIWSGIAFLLIIAIYLLLTQGFPLKYDLWGIVFAFLAGAAMSFGSLIFYNLLKGNPVSILIAVTSLYPVVTILLSVFILKESISVIKIGGLILAVASLFLLSL